MAAVEVFENHCKELGINSLSEKSSMKSILTWFRLQAIAKEQTPTVPGALVFSPIKAATSDKCGAGSASLEHDPSFPSGVAVYQPGAESHWSVQWGYARELNPGGTWRLKLLVKSKKATKEGELVRCGVYSSDSKRVALEINVPPPPGVEDGFVWIDAGEVKLTAGEYLIVFAGAARKCCTEGFWIDRMELWPEDAAK